MTQPRRTIDIALADASPEAVAALAPRVEGNAAVGQGGNNLEPASAGSRTNIFDLDRVSLEDFFEQTLGEKRFRAHQVMKWIHHRHVTDFNDRTDLGKSLRGKLERHAQVRAPVVILDKPSADGTHKWLLGMDTSNAIEAVFVPAKGPRSWGVAPP